MGKKNISKIKGSHIQIGGNYIVGDQNGANTPKVEPLEPNRVEQQSTHLPHPKDILLLISSSKLDEALGAIQQLVTAKADADDATELVMLQEKWTRLKRNIATNTLGEAEKERRYSQIVYNLLQLCNRLGN